MEENSPLIDRFETFAQMAQLEFVRCANNDHSHLDVCSTLLRDVSDDRLVNIRNLLTRDARPLENNAAEMGFFDEYTRGKYEQVSRELELFLAQHPGEITLYELAARSKAHAALQVQREEVDSRPIYELIIAQMRILFELQGDMIRARFELQRLAILCRSHGAARMIAAFLQPNRHAAVGLTNSEESLILALNSNLANPWSYEPVTQLSGGDWLASQSRIVFPASISLELHECLRLELIDASAKLAQLDIPDGRRQAYLGHCFFRANRVDSAILSYNLAIQLEPVFGVVACGLPLFSALFAKGDIAACLDLVVGQYLTNQNTQVIFPLKRLLEAASDATGGNQFHLDLALAAQIYADDHGATFNGLRSDAFENFLDSFGVGRPSELPLDSDGIATERLISFLYKVCTVETLEDSTIFATYEDVETERITILQRLIEYDSDNEELYSGEIRQLTEDAEVARLLQEFEGSRIYVNEQGVLRSLEGELRDAFSRYKQLLAEPSLEYQAGDIRRRIKELIDRSDPKVDMSNFHLPATEREGLFRRMYGGLVNSFVLDPHYGLKTYLSTNILHGALEGELRHSLGKRGLLLVGDNDTVEKCESAQGQAVAGIGSNVLKAINKRQSRWGHRRRRSGPHPNIDPLFATKNYRR
ncbi:hypothetical protein [Bradyrhizobium sp. 45]|uniref:hypothetical protein n=1 Tax=Bradyrhizobium sp. 45 TaxID=1043587 RepID=UPI001FFBC0C2|nr:hypothetical protein [Bradyrhizobium sp. 45]MCK1307657.1 hypothetical protein [Bradyrhizobium sp. 45]